MDYKQKYNEAIKRAKKIHDETEFNYEKGMIEEIFPELTEFENERVRNLLIKHLEQERGSLSNDEAVEAISWLEKQAEQKYVDKVDKVESKFHEGNWITNGQLTCKVLRATNKSYKLYLYNDDYCHFEIDAQSVNKYYHLWTIQDAKDGDVLAFDNDNIVIFKDLYNATTFHSYCHIEYGIFDISKDGMPDWWEGGGFHPATKEQRDLLFSKMKESDYKWDAEKKEAKKIEQKSADEEMKEALRTEYEKGRADVIAEIQKSAWSEEDENILDAITYTVKNSGYKHCIGVSNEMMITFIKSLKGRVQPKQEWSEKDEEKFRDVIRLIEQGAPVQSIRDHYINWLKSIKTRIR